MSVSAAKPEFWARPGPWLVVAYVVIIVGGLYYNHDRSGASRRQAVAEAKVQAVRASEVQRCLASRPVLKDLSKHLRGVGALARVAVLNGVAAVSATPADDPQLVTRRENLARSIIARSDIDALPDIRVPTKAQCHELARDRPAQPTK